MTTTGNEATLYVSASAEGPWVAVPVAELSWGFKGELANPVRPFVLPMRGSGRLTRAGWLRLARAAGLPLRSRARRRSHRLAMKRRGRL